MRVRSIITDGISYPRVISTPSYMSVVLVKKNVSIRFYPNKKKRKGDACRLYCRIIYARLKAEFSLGVLITLDEWDDHNGQLINKNKNMEVHKLMINLESTVLQILDDRQARGLPVSASIIKKIVEGKMELDSPDGAIYMLLPFVQTFIERASGNKTEYTPATVQHYRTTKEHLKEFLHFKGKDDYPLHLIDSLFIQEFDDHLMSWKQPKLNRAMNRNTANKYHSKLRAVLHDACRRKLIKTNPYEGFKLKRVIPRSDFLLEQEIALITQKRYDNASLEITRDYLLFSIWTGGLRMSDLKELKTFNIVEEDGFYFIHLAQVKTANPVHTPLLPGAVAILKKYAAYQDETGYILPRLSHQKLNEYLKTVGNLSGVHKRMTHKISRHTFGTTICSRNGVPRHLISSWLGHVINKRPTDIYAQITKDESFYWIKKLNELYNKPEYLVK